MTLRELTKEEIRSLSSRNGVKQMVVKDFLMGIGGFSIEAAYENLRRESRLNNWNLRTIQAVSNGILLATTKCT